MLLKRDAGVDQNITSQCLKQYSHISNQSYKMMLACIACPYGTALEFFFLYMQLEYTYFVCGSSMCSESTHAGQLTQKKKAVQFIFTLQNHNDEPGRWQLKNTQKKH
jgi:hypothetical protein